MGAIKEINVGHIPVAYLQWFFPIHQDFVTDALNRYKHIECKKTIVTKYHKVFEWWQLTPWNHNQDDIKMIVEFRLNEVDPEKGTFQKYSEINEQLTVKNTLKKLLV